MNDKGRGLWYLLVGGFVIGLGLVVPGVSGAVLAMVLGLYEPIIAAIAKPALNWRENMKLLIPLGLGAGSSLLLLSRVLEFLFAQHPLPTLYFFFGLVLASLPSMLRLANSKGFRLSYLTSLVLGLAVLGLFIRLPHYFGQGLVLKPSFWALALKGSITGVGLVIPGLSASFLLMALGFYEKLLHAVNTLDFAVLVPVALGLVPSVFLVSKAMHWLFGWNHGHISHAIIGLMLGSLWLAFPGWPRTGREMIVCVLLFATGLALASLFQRKTTRLT